MKGHRILAVTLALTFLGACGTGRTSQWESKPTPTAGAAAAPAGAAGAAGGDVAAGDAAWAARGDRAQAEAAISSWEKAVSARPEDGETLSKLARAYFFLADAHLRKQGPKSDLYLATFEKGVAAAERALAAVSPAFKERVTKGDKVEEAIQVVGREGLEAMYWYSANLGKWARAKGFATTLGNKDRVKGVMTRALAIDPSFFHAAPHRYFGAFYAVAPGFAGGDMDKSKEHFEKSLQLAPTYAGTRILMAETYATKKQDQALFDRLLAEVLATPDNVIPGLEPETRVEKEKALELKAKREELF
jgi:tetratricopeptide (TPR) repeat protein